MRALCHLRNQLVVLFLLWLHISVALALPSLGTGRMIDGAGQFSTTTTTFTGGAALNGVNHQANVTVNSDAIVNLQGSIQVSPSDVGKQADLLVVVGVEPSEPFDGGVDTVYHTLDEFGERSIVDLYNSPTVWLNQLTDHPFKRSVSLTADLPVDIGALGSNVDKNVNYVFIGYRLADGSVIYSPQPIIFNVLGSNPNALPTPKIVQITPTDIDRVTLAWLPVQGDNTSATVMRYEVHISEQSNFQPTTTTLRQTTVGDAQATITGLSAGKDYFVVVRALDSAGKYSENEEHRTFTTFSEPVIVNPNVTIIEDKSVGLGQATQQGDTYVYQDASGNPPSVGTILFANVGDETHLRKVESVTATGNGLSVQTTDAELTEVLHQGTISNEVTLFDVDAEAARVGQRSNLRTSRTARDGGQQTIMRWQNDVLVAEQTNYGEPISARRGTRKFSVSQEVSVEASVKFEPQLTTHITWKKDLLGNTILTGAEVILRGALTAELSTSYDFKAAGSVKKEFPLFTTKIFTRHYIVGGVPVYQREVYSLKAELSVKADGKIKATAGAKASAGIEMGVRLNPQDGSWQTISPSTNFEKSVIADVKLHGGVYGEIRLIPNVWVEFYRVVATDLSVEPVVSGNIGVDSIPKGELLAEFGYEPMQLTKFDINLQLQAFAKVSMGIFSKKSTVLAKTKFWESPKWLLFSLPKLSVSGGSGKVNESINLTATTTDGKNNPFQDGSIKWFVSPNKATVSGGKAGTLTSSNEGSYTVFFSGHGEHLGDPLARQFVPVEVNVSKKTDQPQSTGGHGVASRCHNIKNHSHGIANQCSGSKGGSLDDKYRKQGIWNYISSDGSFHQETYLDGILNGYSGWWKADCTPDYYGNYVNGEKDGVWTMIYRNGEFWKRTYSLGILNGYSGWWKADGSPKGSHGNYINGREDGVWITIDPIWTSYGDGSFREDTYVNGILNGYSGYWTTDCKPIGWHGNYLGDKKEGVWLDINSDDSYDKHIFVNDVLNGLSGGWKADGTPIGWHGSYVNGSKEGVWTYYCDNGKSYTSSYANGNHQGDVGSCY
jgi:antitoxin component YwqK of YwqJK toxin-antitoxin module